MTVTPPSGWTSQPLKVAALINSEVLPETTPADREMLYVDVGNVDSNGTIAGAELMLFGDAPSRARRLVRSGDTIISTVRTYLRAIAHLGDPPGDMVVSTGFAVLRPRSDVDPRFLAWAVRSEPFIQSVIASSVGVGYPAVAPTDLGRLPITVPRMSAQLAIADYLDRETVDIDRVIGQKQRLAALLFERWSARLSAAFAGVEKRRLPLKRAARKLQTGTTPSTEIGSYFDGNVPFHGPSSIGGPLDMADAGRTVTQSALSDGAARLFPRGSTAIVTIGATSGRVGYLTAEGATNQQITVVIPDERKVIARFLAYQLRAREPEIRVLASTTTIPIVDLTALANLSVNVPSLSEQEMLVREFDAHRERLRQLTDHLQRQQALILERRAALITAAVTGRLDIPAA